MASQKKPTVRIELTEEQRKKIRQATGKDAAAIEFSAEELEDRIAPSSFNPDADLA
ncbi:MAG: hypothetical protein HY561_06095 [Gemmatimonadetes bacterium]|nr:hypothetical protein [Gemmatimonadota bacterium]